MIRTLLISLTLMIGATGASFGQQAYVDGQHYEKVVPQQPVQSGDKIEVLEIFWYGCPHCYHFEPHLAKWLASKAADVEFRRMPGVFRKDWVPHARAYYTAETLGVLDKVHTQLFEALHKDRKPIVNQEQLADFFADQGIAREKFEKTYNSFAIDSKTRQAVIMSREYGISGVPAVIVNGKYRSSGTMAGGFDELLKVIDRLVDKEREASADQAAVSANQHASR